MTNWTSGCDSAPRIATRALGTRHWQWRNVLVPMLCFLVSVDQVVAQSVEPMQKLVICPPGDGLRDLFQHPDEWIRARGMVEAILYADHNLARFSDTDLQAWFMIMQKWNIKLELEVGAIKEWGPTADATFRAEQPVWDRILRLGANVGSIVMDEPLAAARALGHKSDSYAVEQTVRFVGLVRQHYPSIRIGDVEPYPSVSLVDHIGWLKQLTSKLQDHNVAALDFYRADVDWVAFTKTARGSWLEVSSMADATRAAGLRFSLIYWASGYPSAKVAGLAGDDTWYVQVLGQGYAVAGAGIKPDQFVLESWIDAPKQIVPDNAGFTFTRSVADFGHKFVGFNDLSR